MDYFQSRSTTLQYCYVALEFTSILQGHRHCEDFRHLAQLAKAKCSSQWDRTAALNSNSL